MFATLIITGAPYTCKGDDNVDMGDNGSKGYDGYDDYDSDDGDGLPYFYLCITNSVFTTVALKIHYCYNFNMWILTVTI